MFSDHPPFESGPACRCGCHGLCVQLQRGRRLVWVIGIADGDTITVLDDDKRMVKCRLYGIDAPEKHQAYGAESKASLSEMMFQRIVDIGFSGRDRYGRSICKVNVDGLDVNREQLVRMEVADSVHAGVCPCVDVDRQVLAQQM